MESIFSMMGPLKGHTVRAQLTDASQPLSAIVDTAMGSPVQWNGILAAMITAETYDCRIAFGCAATAALGHILAAGQSVRIPNTHMVSAAQLCNKTAGENSVVQITLES